MAGRLGLEGWIGGTAAAAAFPDGVVVMHGQVWAGCGVVCGEGGCGEGSGERRRARRAWRGASLSLSLGLSFRRVDMVPVRTASIPAWDALDMSGTALSYTCRTGPAR